MKLVQLLDILILFYELLCEKHKDSQSMWYLCIIHSLCRGLWTFVTWGTDEVGLWELGNGLWVGFGFEIQTGLDEEERGWEPHRIEKLSELKLPSTLTMKLTFILYRTSQEYSKKRNSHTGFIEREHFVESRIYCVSYVSTQIRIALGFPLTPVMMPITKRTKDDSHWWWCHEGNQYGTF